MVNIISKVLKKEEFLKFKIILLFNFLTFFLEFISLGSIPIFVGLIIDSSTSLAKLESYGFFYFSTINNENLIKYVGITIIVIFNIKNIFYFSLIYIQGKFVKNFKLKLSKELLNFHIMSPFSYHMQNNPAELTRNSTNNVDCASEYILQAISLFKESITILVIFTLLLIVNPLITISITSIFSIFGFYYLKVIKPSIKKKAKQNENLKMNLIKIVNESFGAIKDIKLLNKEKNILGHYEKNINKVENNYFYFDVFSKTPKLFLETIAIIAITISTLVILNFNKDVFGLFSILSLIVIATIRFIPAFNSIITSIHYLRIYRPYAETIVEELERIEKFKINSSVINENKISVDKDTNFNKNLIFLDDISFSYKKDDKKNILKNISLGIEKGTILGITGETGSGKSTLFHIMLGLLPPKTGNVFHKGKNIHAEIKNWRNQIGYIAQNIYLLDSTIEKNITFDFLDEKIDKERLKFAIKMASLDEKISELPMGLKTEVGNDGLRLSGGEKQRIALARAIYKNPNIYFMDESTSALDSNTEKKIINNMKENFSSKTIILIAHRKTTIEACDKIINLKNGNIN